MSGFSAFLLVFLLVFSLSPSVSAHPTGNMLVINGSVLWSYICPLDDTEHHACVMRFDEDNGVRPWLTSSFASSDWMMAPAPNNKVYLVERYFEQARQLYKVRLLLASVGAIPQEIIPWFDDVHRFGEGGFVGLEDGRFLFARYPNIYQLNQDRSVTTWQAWPEPVLGLRQISDGLLLIRGESQVWLSTQDGRIEQSWSGLLQTLTSKPPFMGNRIFDADYSDEALWLAYWGKRRFEVIRAGNRTVLKAFNKPWLAHAVALDGKVVYMLASTLEPDYERGIRPNLWRIKDEKPELLWGEAEVKAHN